MIKIDDGSDIDDLAEEIVIMQETTGMSFKRAIVAVLSRYEVEVKDDSRL